MGIFSFTQVEADKNGDNGNRKYLRSLVDAILIALPFFLGALVDDLNKTGQLPSVVVLYGAVLIFLVTFVASLKRNLGVKNDKN